MVEIIRVKNFTYHFGVDGHLSETLALAPNQGVGLVTEERLPHAARGDAQQVAAAQGLHTLLLRPVDHAEHLQQQLEA